MPSADDDWEIWRGEPQPPVYMLKRECDAFSSDPSKIDPAQKLSICLREDDTTVEAKVDVDGDADRPPVIIPLFREIERENEASDSCIQWSRQYISSGALISRLIERRDENPISVDYDVDSEDEALLEIVNSEADREILSVDELEAAIHRLEVESFDVMLQHVQVPTCTTYIDASQPGVFAPLSFRQRSSRQIDAHANKSVLGSGFQLTSHVQWDRALSSQHQQQPQLRAQSSPRKRSHRDSVAAPRPSCPSPSPSHTTTPIPPSLAAKQYSPNQRVPEHVKRRQQQRKLAAEKHAMVQGSPLNPSATNPTSSSPPQLPPLVPTCASASAVMERQAVCDGGGGGGGRRRQRCVVDSGGERWSGTATGARWRSPAPVRLEGWQNACYITFLLDGPAPCPTDRASGARACGSSENAAMASAARVEVVRGQECGGLNGHAPQLLAAVEGFDSTQHQEVVKTERERNTQALIEASPPRKLSEAEELGVCAVCLNDGAEEGNVIILCEGCGIAVHQICYGVSDIPADGDKWFCDRCRSPDGLDAQCMLCPMPHGALKHVEAAGKKMTPNKCATTWCHVSCAFFMPGMRFGDALALEPIVGVEDVNKARWKLTCTLCKQKHVGACIQCSDPKCPTAMHVTCAQNAQLFMEWVDDSQDVHLNVFCRRHTPKDRAPNFSVCPELAANPALLLTVMTGTPPTTKARTDGAHAVTTAKASSNKQRGGAAVGQAGTASQEGKNKSSRDARDEESQRRHKGSGFNDALSTAATPVSSTLSTLPSLSPEADPFALIAPSTCAVCLLPSDDAGSLLSCEGCQVTVHQHCWGRAILSPSGAWQCDKCREGCGVEAQCSLCPSAGGALKKTLAGDWLHLQCALWIPELQFNEPELLQGISAISRIPKDRRLLTCALCKGAGGSGACIQCAKGGCFTAFHVTCAQLAGYHMVMLSGDDDDDEVPSLQPFCPKHRPRFIWKGHYVDSLKFLTIEDILPLSLMLAEDHLLALVSDALRPQTKESEHANGATRESTSRSVYQHWLSKRQRKGHFLSQHHVVATQDLVSFLPGEWEQHKHKNPFYIKPAPSASASSSHKRKKSRFTAPRKSHS